MKKERAKQQPIYKAAGFYMVRAPVLSADTFLRIMGSLPKGDGEALDSRFAAAREQSYSVLRQLASDPLVEQALQVASADLSEGVARLHHQEGSPRRVQRAYAGLLRYLVRMSTRPTPFGLFSGVAVGNLAESTTAEIGIPSIEHFRTRPDMSWLLSVIQKLETDSALFPSFNVLANQSIYSTGSRFILPTADIYGQQDHRSIAIRATPVVEHVLRNARQTLPYRTLRQDLCMAFPTATQPQIDGLLRQLWEYHFLISDLRPPLTSPDPAKYLLEGLRKIPDPAIASLRDALADIIQETKTIDQQATENKGRSFQSLKVRQETLLPAYKGPYYQVDAALHLEHAHINQLIGEAAAEIAEVLLRMTRLPRGVHHLREYDSAFRERYGTKAEVPLLDLLNPETGLGAPTGYIQPPRVSQLPYLPQSFPNIDSFFYSLLIEAAHTHTQEIELTDELLERLTQWTPQAQPPPPPAMDICLQIEAASASALDRGEWRGVLAPMAFSHSGRIFCRFFDILDEEGLNALHSYTRCEEELLPDVVVAELSYLPTSGRGANVAIRPALHTHEIVLNTTPSVPPERVISLNDLVVGIKNDRFYIRSLSLGREVVVTQSNMLNYTKAPNICRFLLEASRDSRLGLAKFDWGPAGQAPFLPRLVRKKIIVSLAQWNVSHSTIQLGNSGSAEIRFFEGLQDWRKQWYVPRYVYLTQSDNRLLLDLEHPLSVAELGRHLKQLKRDSTLLLQEMLPDFEHLWLRDKLGAPYLCEVVIPLLLQEEKKKEEPLPRGSGRYAIASSERRLLPGAEWTFLKIYADPKHHNEIIIGDLREIVQRMQAQQLIDRWFFIRYADPEPHLRIRFHAAQAECNEQVLLTALTWGRELAKYGMISNIVVDSYSREIERYGGPRAIEAMEEIFSANSIALCEVIAAIYQRQVTLDPQLIAVVTLDQFFEMWGMDFTRRLEYFQGIGEKYEDRTAFRPHRKLLCELLAPWDPDYDPSIREQRELLQHLCATQSAALSQTSMLIRTLATQGELWGTERQILSSLAHMHINRLLGINRDQESRIYAFWRHGLESLQRRPTSKTNVPGRLRSSI